MQPPKPRQPVLYAPDAVDRQSLSKEHSQQLDPFERFIKLAAERPDEVAAALAVLGKTIAAMLRAVGEVVDELLQNEEFMSALRREVAERLEADLTRMSDHLAEVEKRIDKHEELESTEVKGMAPASLAEAFMVALGSLLVLSPDVATPATSQPPRATRPRKRPSVGGKRLVGVQRATRASRSE